MINKGKIKIKLILLTLFVSSLHAEEVLEKKINKCLFQHKVHTNTKTLLSCTDAIFEKELKTKDRIKILENMQIYAPLTPLVACHKREAELVKFSGGTIFLCEYYPQYKRVLIYGISKKGTISSYHDSSM
ncbi:MAG: hypothetical protein EHM20_15955 [Alphaproteobacteria bacterium]|nr:MAG: hypothetical protein EHM20_15955 [Alphaproteobacteria bacterium]